MKTSAYAFSLILTFSTACGGESFGDLAISSGYAELIATDPLRNSFDFERGEPGKVLQEDEVRIARSHLDFSGYFDDELAVGVQGADRAMIVHLGSDDELAGALDREQTVGGGQGFAGLSRDATGRFSLEAANAVFADDPDTWRHSELWHAPVVDGDVYVVRILTYEGMELVVKLLIVGHDPGRRVEFEWARL